MKLLAAILGAILLAGGVAVAIVHYVVAGGLAASYITLAIAAVLLFAGWTLLDWGAAVSRRWYGNKQK